MKGQAWISLCAWSLIDPQQPLRFFGNLPDESRFYGRRPAKKPDKIFIGQLEGAFDWLGYQFDASGLASVAARTLHNHQVKIRRLYEQALRLHLPKLQTQQRVIIIASAGDTGLHPSYKAPLSGGSKTGRLDQARPWDVKIPYGIVI